MIRVAAVGDIHLAPDLAGKHRPGLAGISDRADVLLLAGDLTRHGTVEEAKVVASEYAGLGVPVIAVLGNHDYQSNQQDAVTRVLLDGGICVLEGDGVVMDLPAGQLGVAGAKGFCLGFSGRCASEFGEPEMKAFTRHGRESANRLAEGLARIRGADVSVALTHFSPVDDTLVGEPPEIWAFLGNYLLAEAIDRAGVDLAVHGHSHAGTEKGVTAGGVRVRNVAQPVIGAAYAIYEVHGYEITHRAPLHPHADHAEVTAPVSSA